MSIFNFTHICNAYVEHTYAMYTFGYNVHIYVMSPLFLT